jgi:HEPN domain-containing protein
LIASLEYLPEHKQEELKEICELIVEEMHPAMILLFGSYARNTWAEEITREEGINLEFKSDYDLLIVTAKDLTKTANTQWLKTQQKVSNRKFSTSVSLIQHSAGYINKELKAGGYFFTDVIKEGKVLFNSGEIILDKPGNVDPVEVKKRAKEEFEKWFENANNFLQMYSYAFEKGLLKNAAFELHQTTEALYSAFLLVFTGYKGKLHDLEELGTQIAKIQPEFKTVFPMDSKDHIERYHLLKRAYIDARYKKDYKITKEDLVYLSERVEVLKELVGKVCAERIAG